MNIISKNYIYVSKYLSEILNKKEIISDAHSGILSGHYSIEKTLQRIRQKYKINVKKFISKYESYQFNKLDTQKPYYIYISLQISLKLLMKRYL